MRNYIALIHKRAGGDYGVSFPDLPGCVTSGTDLDDAHAMAAEALALHVEGLVEDGEATPEPSSLEAVMAERLACDAVAMLVPTPRLAKVVRINITLPEPVLQRIDQFAEAHGFTRSGFLRKAAKRQMEAASGRPR